MNIAYKNFNTTNMYQKSDISFKALGKGLYKSGQDNICIYEIEKKDLPYIKEVTSKIDEYVNKNNLDLSIGAIIKQSLYATEILLSKPETKTDKTKIFLAESNSRPCGILVANMPKKTNWGKRTYSGRTNQNKKETELDYLVTWSEKGNPKIKGVGKTIVNEYFLTLKKDDFKQVYVRSEIPEYSYATDFYKSLGFKFLSNKQENLEKKTSNKYLFETKDNPTDKIYPMLIRSDNIQKTINEISLKYHRQDLSHHSANLSDIISKKS